MGETIKLPPVVPSIELEENARLVFKGWQLSDQDTIDHAQVDLVALYPLRIVAIWVKQYYVDVKSEFGEVTGSGWYDENSEAVISLSEEIILLNQDERVAFIGCNIKPRLDNTDSHSKAIILRVDKPYVIEANWKRQFRVKIIDVKGIAIGGGWYDDGSIESVHIRDIMIYDAHDEGRRYRFVGWSGDCTGGECDLETVTLKVVKPMILEAKWLSEYKVTLRSLPKELADEIFEGLEEIWVSEGALFLYKAPAEIKTAGDMAHVFKGWCDEHAHIMTTDEEISLIVNEPITIIAVYELRRDIATAGYTMSYSTIILLVTIILLPMLVMCLAWTNRMAKAKRVREIDEK